MAAEMLDWVVLRLMTCARFCMVMSDTLLSLLFVIIVQLSLYTRGSDALLQGLRVE
jgi:hypothetical protein